MPRYILDTNIFTHAIRNDAARRELAAWQRSMAPFIYQHSVVSAEILIGARDSATFELWHERWIAPAERLHRVVTPTHSAWTRATQIITRLLESKWLPSGGVKQSFFNDCLLAASVREHGCTLVTHNLADFELIASVEPKLAFKSPFP